MATVKHALSGNSPGTDTAAEKPARGAGKGLRFQRYFTDGKKSPFDAVEWEKRTALIGNEKGVTIFRQEDVEVPKSWSQTATNIVTSKYFHGKSGTAQREGSVRQLIGRVVSTIVRWGEQCGYFADAESRDAFRDELDKLAGGRSDGAFPQKGGRQRNALARCAGDFFFAGEPKQVDDFVHQFRRVRRENA